MVTTDFDATVQPDEVFGPDRPWLYPGRTVVESLVLGLGAGGAPATLRHRAGMPLAKAVVRTRDGDGLLDDVLATHAAPTVDARFPVASYGSNGDPAVLRRKFGAGGVSDIVPLLPGRMANACLAASAHVSRPGYIPAAALRRDGSSLPVVVAWLDAEQVRCLDATEVNYRRLTADTTVHELVLASGETLEGAVLYGTTWGVIPPDQDGFSSQIDVWQQALAASASLRALLSVAPSVDENSLRIVMARLARDEALRAQARRCLAEIAVPSGLVGGDTPHPDQDNGRSQG